MPIHGFDIGRLMSARFVRSPPGSGDSDSDESLGSRNASPQTMRKESWFTTRPPQTKICPTTPINSSRPQSLIHNVSSYQLSLFPDEDSRSSASSLYSCESSTDIAGIRRSTLCSISSKNVGSELSFQISGATSLEGDELYPLLRDDDRLSALMSDKLYFRPRSGLMEPLPLNLKDRGKGTRQPDRAGDASTHFTPENVEQLIQEADGAFKETCIVLTNLDSNRTSFNETPRLPPTPITRRPTRRTAIHPQHKKRYRLSRAPAFVSPANSPRRNPSVSKVKRSKSAKKRKTKSQRKLLNAKYTTRHNSKWTENVSDLLSWKRFQKIEADEMLTPAQISAYTLRRLSKLPIQGTTKTGASLSHDADTVPETPVEPFHMDDLPSRIGSSGVKLTATPVDVGIDLKFFGEVWRRDFSLTRSGVDDELFLGVTTPGVSSPRLADEDPSASADTTYSDSQIQICPSRYMFKNVPGLPMISESGPQDNALFLPHGLSRPFDDVADVDYVFFRSTPFTVTAPSYRHGPIRLAKADLYPDPTLGADDGGLDWTAFQMAIQGGAGDYFTDSEYLIRRYEAEDAEAVCEWWDAWGFGGCGSIVTRDDEPPRTSIGAASKRRGDRELLYHDIGHDNPYSARHRWQSLQRKAASEGRRLDLDLHRGSKSDKLYNGGGIKKWSADGHASRLRERGSLASLPQSPMLDLRVITSDNGDVDYVPMGFNLSHDLGDFLSWEAEHVYSDHALYDGGVI